MKTTSNARKAIRRILRFFPTPNWTIRYPHLSRLESSKKNVLCEILMRETGNTVFAGPFSTMRLAEGLSLASDPRMIVGSYEQEVHGIINEVICEAPGRIIDIGAAFGYYAVGFALKCANSSIYAFEAVEERHWAELASLARLNGVESRVIQKGFCGTEQLTEVCTPGSFVLSDCEGGEMDLLDPGQIPNLSACKILIELHEFYRPNLVATLVPRFAKTHKIEIIEERTRDPAAYRILKKLPASWRGVAIEECKWTDEPKMTTWLRFMLLTPK